MSGFENRESGIPAPEEKSLVESEIILIESEIIKRACGDNEEKKLQWIEKNAGIFREIIEEPEIIKMIRNNRPRAIEEIERKIAERKAKEN